MAKKYNELFTEGFCRKATSDYFLNLINAAEWIRDGEIDRCTKADVEEAVVDTLSYIDIDGGAADDVFEALGAKLDSFEFAKALDSFVEAIGTPVSGMSFGELIEAIAWETDPKQAEKLWAEIDSAFDEVKRRRLKQKIEDLASGRGRIYGEL